MLALKMQQLVFTCSSYRRHHAKLTASCCHIKDLNQKVNKNHTLVSCSGDWRSLQNICRLMQ